MQTVMFNAYLSKEIYQSLVPRDHFLRQLQERFDWPALTNDLNRLAQNAHGGRPRYSPTLLFKMLLLSFLFDLSDRDTAAFATNTIPAKYFLGLPITEEAPDFTTLSVFRTEILERFGSDWITNVFRRVLTEAKEAGISFGTIHALDATHTRADVNTFAERERRERGETPRDPDAAWGVKGTERKQTVDGETVEIRKTFHGYKSHVLAETAHGLITALSVSPSNVADVTAGEELLLKKLTPRERAAIGTLTTDKGYGDAVLIKILERDHGILTAFSLSRTFLKGEHAEAWELYLEDPRRVAARKKRSVIERTFADLKDNHGLRQSRYLGLLKYYFQAMMAALAHNVKTMLTLFTGARLRPI